jgi:hypothetical protein
MCLGRTKLATALVDRALLLEAVHDAIQRGRIDAELPA